MEKCNDRLVWSPILGLIAVVFCRLLTGCGGQSTAVGACNAMCEQQAKATGCGSEFNADDYQRSCMGLCEFTEHVEAECTTKTRAYYRCAAKEAWRCVDGLGSLPQLAREGACKSELAAQLAACMLQQQ